MAWTMQDSEQSLVARNERLQREYDAALSMVAILLDRLGGEVRISQEEIAGANLGAIQRDDDPIDRSIVLRRTR